MYSYGLSLFILVLSARSMHEFACAAVRSKDAQKQLARTSLKEDKHLFRYWASSREISFFVFVHTLICAH